MVAPTAPAPLAQNQTSNTFTVIVELPADPARGRPRPRQQPMVASAGDVYNAFMQRLAQVARGAVVLPAGTEWVFSYVDHQNERQLGVTRLDSNNYRQMITNMTGTSGNPWSAMVLWQVKNPRCSLYDMSADMCYRGQSGLQWGHG